MFQKQNILYTHKSEYDIIRCIIENNIQLAAKKHRNYCDIPTNDLGSHLYYFEHKLIENGFKVTINSMFMTIRW